MMDHNSYCIHTKDINLDIICTLSDITSDCDLQYTGLPGKVSTSTMLYKYGPTVLGFIIPGAIVATARLWTNLRSADVAKKGMFW